VFDEDSIQFLGFRNFVDFLGFSQAYKRLINYRNN
jgi:hypothetical protein